MGSNARGRFLLVVLSSSTSIAAALAPGTWVMGVWLAMLLAVLGQSGWLARRGRTASAPNAPDAPAHPDELVTAGVAAGHE